MLSMALFYAIEKDLSLRFKSLFFFSEFLLATNKYIPF